MNSNQHAASLILSALLNNATFCAQAATAVKQFYSSVPSVGPEETIHLLMQGEPANVYTRYRSYNADKALDLLAGYCYSNGYVSLRRDSQVRRPLLAMLIQRFNPNDAADVAGGLSQLGVTIPAIPESSMISTNPVKVTKVTRITINGSTSDAKNFSNDQIIGAIAAGEKQLKDLSELTTQSSAIDKAKADIAQGLKDLAAVLDARATPSEAAPAAPSDAG